MVLDGVTCILISFESRTRGRSEAPFTCPGFDLGYSVDSAERN